MAFLNDLSARWHPTLADRKEPQGAVQCKRVLYIDPSEQGQGGCAGPLLIGWSRVTLLYGGQGSVGVHQITCAEQAGAAWLA